MDDFRPAQSDIDLLVLVRGRLLPTASKALAHRLSFGRLPCPARMLELVVLRMDVATKPCMPLAYKIGIDMDPHGPVEISERGEECDLLIDLAICREYGVP